MRTPGPLAPYYGYLVWLNQGRKLFPSAPESSYFAVGAGSSFSWVEPERKMVVVVRWLDPAHADEFFGQVLAAVDARFQKAVDAAVAEENQRWGKPGVITVVRELVGDRPAGSTPENSSIVRNGLAAATVLGFTSNLGEGSTDSNIPMSLSIPSITIGGGGRGRDAHALTESFDTTDAWMGTQHALLLTIALTQK